MSMFGITVLFLMLLFACTSLGAILVFCLKKESNLFSVIANGFSSGIMFSASIFSLLLPSLNYQNSTVVLVVVGFLSGCFFLVILEIIVSILRKNRKNYAYKLFFAVTLHNIPEGMSVGFAFGSSYLLGIFPASSIAMAVGVAIQNIPEGLSVSLPMLKITKSKKKSAFFGVLSGIVEPIFGILGYFLASSISFLMPILLAFSAGAMIYVVVEDLLPTISYNNTVGTWSFIFGFILMLVLDVCL